MNIFVCIKPVPDPEKYGMLAIDRDTKRLIREGIPTIVNPADKNALEAALQIKEMVGGKVIVVSMAPLFSQDKLKECLAMGADEAYLLSDPAFGGADTYSTSYTLAKGIEKTGIEPDLVLAGNVSADGATSHVPSQLGEWLGLPHISNIDTISIDDGAAKVRKKMDENYINYKIKLPAVIGITIGTNKPRLISAMGVIRAKNKPLTVFARDDLDVDSELIGMIGSPTQAGELHSVDVERQAEELNGNPAELAEQIISILKRNGISVKN